MTVELHAFALLCGLAAVAFSAAGAQRGPLRLAVWWLTFAPALLFLYPAGRFSGLVPQIGFEPTQIAMLLVIMSAVLLRYPLPSLSAAWSGLIAAVWLATLLNGQIPVAAAWLLAAGLPLLGVMLSWRHAGFSTRSMREEARIIILLSALAMTVIPALVASWQFHGATSLTETANTEAVITDTGPYLTDTNNTALLLLLLVTLLAGLLYRVLTRRKLQ